MDELERLVHALCSSPKRAAGPWLVLAAHPDDETIGASFVLSRAPDLTVLFVTDGAPRNRRWWPRDAPDTREAYARLRQEEARRALALAAWHEPHTVRLGMCDQEVSLELVALTYYLIDLFRHRAPSIVLVPPYEGGHPDHDATSFAARAAHTLLLGEPASNGQASPPLLIEMTSYHRRDDTLCCSAFLHDTQSDAVRILLGARERTLKQDMLACFASQAEVLAPFGCAEESFRKAPRYDFTRPPHAGALHYETLGFALSGDMWRNLAACALGKLGMTHETSEV